MPGRGLGTTRAHVVSCPERAPSRSDTAASCRAMSTRCWRCRALALGKERELPQLAKRKAPTEVRAAAAYVRRGDAVLLRQMPAHAPRWAGLWVLPFAELTRTEKAPAGAARALKEIGITGTA